MIAPILKFDSNGKFVRAFGANIFIQPHGLYVDNDGNVWATDNGVLNGKGAIVVKFSPTGQVLMTLGKPGMPGNAEGFFRGASSVVVAPNGDIFVGDGHGANTNDRLVKFDKTGKQIATWGKHGKAQGEFDQLHGIAMDSQGRIFVADRGNSRLQVFDSDGKFVAEWKQFGRPSDVAIDKNDVIYVTDDQSNQNNNPGFKTGIRIGSKHRTPRWQHHRIQRAQPSFAGRPSFRGAVLPAAGLSPDRPFWGYNLFGAFWRSP
jgi:sugar lactone lactonase YvrE